MKLLLDEMYAGLKEYLEMLGNTVLTAQEAGLQGAKDRDVVEYASKQDMILITQDQKPAELELEGYFSVHGVKREITVQMTVTYIKESEATGARHPGDLLHIVGTFDILLSEYSIRRPQFVILKLDDKQRIDIDIFAATGLPPVELAQK